MSSVITASGHMTMNGGLSPKKEGKTCFFIDITFSNTIPSAALKISFTYTFHYPLAHR
jgi:hypothetical protein